MTKIVDASIQYINIEMMVIKTENHTWVMIMHTFQFNLFSFISYFHNVQKSLERWVTGLKGISLWRKINL